MKLFLGSILAGLASLSLASAQTTWSGGTGAYEASVNWTPAVVPGMTTDVVVSSGNINQTSPQQYGRTFSFQGGTTNLSLGGGSVLTIIGETPTADARDFVINQGATLNLSGGTLQFQNGLGIVGDTNGSGTLNLTSGSLNFDFQTDPNATQINVANGGTGTINQTGSSTVTSGNILFIGTNGGTGNYNLNDSSTLQTGNTLTSGNHFIVLGANNTVGQTTAGTVGRMTLLNDSTLTINSDGDLQIGAVSTLFGSSTVTPGVVGGTGILTQNSAGSNVNIESGGVAEIGTYTGANGTYNLQAGSLNVTDGVLAVSDGDGATGTFNQTGGTVNGDFFSEVFVGYRGTGTYNLSAGTTDLGGLLSVGTQSGSTGTINQTGGTLILESGSATFIGESGTGVYNLSGGTATFNDALTVGTHGTINQTGGTLTILAGEDLTITSGGNYNLKSGVLQMGSSSITGAGSFNLGGGTLQVTGGNITDLLGGTVTGNSTLDTTNGNILFAGGLSGSGGFTIIGGSTVTLGGTNTFTGPIDIKTGVLQTQIASLNANPITIESNGTLNLDSQDGDIHAGIIAGAGTFNLGFGAAGATVELINTVNVTGTTTFGSNGLNGNLQIFGGTLGNLGDNGTASNLIIGGDPVNGPLTGIINLTGSNTYGGSTTINSGFTVYTDNLPGDVINSGTLGISPGSPNATDVFFIGGSYTSPTGTTIVRSVGNAADLFNVAGNVDMSGSTITLQGFGSTDTPLTIVSAGGTASATLPTLVVGGNNNGLFSASIAKNGETYELTTVQQPTVTYAVTPNQQAVSGGLDTVLVHPGAVFMGNPPPANFVAMATALNNLTTSQIPAALDQLSPQSLQYSRNIAFENSTILASHLSGHLATLRSGYSGLDTSGLSFLMPGFEKGMGRSLGSLLAFNNSAPNGVNYYSSDFDTASGSGGRSISDSPNPIGTAPAPASSRPFASDASGPLFSEFVSGDVILADLNRDHSAANAPSDKASYTAGDATAGISFRMTSDLAAGVLFNYNHTDAKTDSNGSKIKVDSYSPGLFATYFKNGFHVDGLFSYGYNDYDNTRNISFLNSTASSSPSGSQYVGNLDFGYDFTPDPHWTLGPTLGVTYTHLDVDSFTETGAGAANLTVNEQHADSLRSRLGGHIAYQIHSGPVLYQPNFGLAWQHEYLDSASGITSQLNVPGSSGFTIQTAAPSRDSALLTFGVNAILDNSMGLYLNYLANVGASDYFAQSVEGGFKARF